MHLTSASPFVLTAFRVLREQRGGHRNLSLRAIGAVSSVCGEIQNAATSVFSFSFFIFFFWGDWSFGLSDPSKALLKDRPCIIFTYYRCELVTCVKITSHRWFCCFIGSFPKGGSHVASKANTPVERHMSAELRLASHLAAGKGGWESRSRSGWPKAAQPRRSSRLCGRKRARPLCGWWTAASVNAP